MIGTSYTEAMARLSKSPPPSPMMRYRLVVEARAELPKRYVWKVVHDNNVGETVVLQRSRDSYGSMETAYENGRPTLAEIRARMLKLPQ
jgi:hypothetical protein